MAIQESGEMYLETILILSRKKDIVRAIDISEMMNFSKPSVSRAMSILRKDGLITIDGLGSISLTATGQAIAEKIYERHCVLSRILCQLGVDEEIADEDACRIEHVISDESFRALKKHFE